MYKTKEERTLLKKLKKQFEEAKRAEFGFDWKQIYKKKCIKIIVS